MISEQRSTVSVNSEKFHEWQSTGSSKCDLRAVKLMKINWQYSECAISSVLSVTINWQYYRCNVRIFLSVYIMCTVRQK